MGKSFSRLETRKNSRAVPDLRHGRFILQSIDRRRMQDYCHRRNACYPDRMISRVALAVLVVCGMTAPFPSRATDERPSQIVDLNTPRDFPVILSRAEWEARAVAIRENVEVSCGLWPMPAKTPLEARVSGRIGRDGYTVEKVYFQTFPGFYLAGSLYRPLGRGPGPFPGVLNPHGHWADGRMADNDQGSIAARCIQQARMGMVAFSYDMVGYNDTIQIPNHRDFALDPTNQLWSVSLMGLQAWNSVRAVDFLESLADVDPKRLACTGESGGGTQTFVLGAIDDRLALQAPIVMVSHTMQGGCLCENAPGLRVEYSNMEIAASAAPRPQFLVGARGDWTKDTMTVEGPALKRIYILLGAEDHLRYTRFDFDHNYNQTSREAVYGWLDQWLTGGPAKEKVDEIPYKKEPTGDLRVFPDGKLPPDALGREAVIQAVIRRGLEAREHFQPENEESLKRYRAMETVAWRRALHLESPVGRIRADVREAVGRPAFGRIELRLGREGAQDDIRATLFRSTKEPKGPVVVMAHPRGLSVYLDAAKQPSGLARALLNQGSSVLLFDAFMTGPLADAGLMAARNPLKGFFTTYNRTVLQERVQDVITCCAYARGAVPGVKVYASGEGEAGLWALLAAPEADGVMADADGFDGVSLSHWMKPEMFTPGILAIGGLDAVASLAAPRPMLIYHAPPEFASKWLRQTYQAALAAEQLKISGEKLSPEEAAEALLKFK